MLKSLLIVLSLFVAISYHSGQVQASDGDRMTFYRNCSNYCYSEECNGTPDGFLPHYPEYYRWIHWDCYEECKYGCMWETIDYLQALKDFPYRRIPQFHGKWPFVRSFGMQEPASSIFSALNGIAHAIMLFYFVRNANPKYQIYYLVISAAFVNINGWTWSAIFHARDLPFTEKMDYFCALSIVLSQFVLAALRVMGFSMAKLGSVMVPVILFYIQHVNSMCEHFDYGYNMAVNVTWVGIGACLWIFYSAYSYYVKKQSHFRLCLVVWLLLSAAGLLELFDFPPILWTFDAHALWHAATVPLTFVWYHFLIQDSFVAKISSEEKAD